MSSRFPVIRLTVEDVLIAAQVGVVRQCSALARRRPEPYGEVAFPWNAGIESCIAELLVSRTLNRAWIPFRRRPRDIAADVGRAVQVRLSPREQGHLILHPEDRDDQAFIAVVGQSLAQRIVGWLMGAEGKQPIYWRTGIRHPAFFIPQSVLHPLDTLDLSLLNA